jgi:N-acetylmuramoyl-L-alanine amidase
MTRVLVLVLSGFALLAATPVAAAPGQTAGPAGRDALVLPKKKVSGKPSSSVGVPAQKPRKAAVDRSFPAMRVALDPGHGGLSTGAIGVAGIYEKHLMLSLARKVRTLLEAEVGIEVFMTRDGDEDVDLASRPARAAAAGADIFVSLHGNASPLPDVRGVETFFLGAASDPGADEVSRRENAEAVTPGPMADDPAVSAILSDLRRNGNLSESASLAEAIHRLLVAACPDTPSRNVRQGNFAVLRRASMPAVVVEVGFMTHAVEGHRLALPSYQDKLAIAIRDGILAFARRTGAAHAFVTRGSPTRIP